MEKLMEVDWTELFVPTHSLAEMIVRGTLMYLGLWVVLRFVMKRQAGSVGIADLLVIVVIADAAQNGFAREYQSVTEGVVLVLTIVFWNFALDWLAYRFPSLRWLVEAPPIPLVRNGRRIRRNLAKELISDDELLSQLREQGVDRVADVDQAFLEGDGQISVIKKVDAGPEPKRRRGPSR